LHSWAEGLTDSGIRFAPTKWIEARHGIHALPLFTVIFCLVLGFTGYKDLSHNRNRFELQQRGRTVAVRGLR